MKKLIILAAFLLSTITFGQGTTYYSGEYAYVDFGTLANSVTETGYAYFSSWTQIDSISVTAIASGELDVDSVDCYVGIASKNLTVFSSTVYHYASTLNLAQGVGGFENLLSSNATLLTSAVMRGANAIKIITRGSTSGNTPGDTKQRLVICLRVWGTK